MALKLTPRQAQILALIQRDMRRTGRPPTRAEIAHEFGFRSANAAEDHLRALERKGYLTLSAATSRGIQLTALALGSDSPAPEPAPLPGHGTWLDPSESRLIPLVGRVAAGHPILAAEHVEREIPLGPHLFESAPDYLLRVRGTSMRDVGILDGDLLAVRSTPDARHGQIIVARLGDEVTVKRLHHQGRVIRLLPENPDFSPIDICASDEFAIEGVAVGLIRTTSLH